MSIVLTCVCACLSVQAVNIRRHLEKNRKDTDSKFRLILVESRIHRLARYYKVSSSSRWANSRRLRTRGLDRPAADAHANSLRGCLFAQVKKALPAVWKYESATASALVA